MRAWARALMGGAASALLTGAAVADDGWRELDGQAAPTLWVDEWENVPDGVEVAEELEGKVWMLVFFATWCEPCMRKVNTLSRLHERYYDLGFRVVAISDEPMRVIRPDLIGDRDASYWIGSDDDMATYDAFLDGETLLLPKVYLVDANGVVVCGYEPSEDKIQELLRDSFDSSFDGDLHEELEASVVNFRRGAFARARELAGEHLEDGSSDLAADAAYVLSRVDAIAEHRRRWIELDLERDEKRPNQYYAEFLDLAVRFEGMELGDWAEDHLERLEDEPSVDKDEKAWKAFRSALDRDVGSDGRPNKVVVARQYFERVAERHGGTEAARRARDAVERLEREIED